MTDVFLTSGSPNRAKFVQNLCKIWSPLSISMTCYAVAQNLLSHVISEIVLWQAAIFRLVGVAYLHFSIDRERQLHSSVPESHFLRSLYSGRRVLKKLYHYQEFYGILHSVSANPIALRFNLVTENKRRRESRDLRFGESRVDLSDHCNIKLAIATCDH